MRGLNNRAGGLDVASALLYQKNDRMRANANMDPNALKALCWHVLATTSEDCPTEGYERGTVDWNFLSGVAPLSRSERGPQLAKELLARHGIPLVIEGHLPKTHLDGAALRLGDGRPVTGPSLRYDRLEKFWFCLLHELAHVGRHMDNDLGDAFVDDHALRKLDGKRGDSREAQADEWAKEALIPRTDWEASTVPDRPSNIAIMNFAGALQVHPAIIAGRVRCERQNHRLLSQFVGTGEVGRQSALTL